jgi:hypothetical protein
MRQIGNSLEMGRTGTLTTRPGEHRPDLEVDSRLLRNLHLVFFGEMA